VSTAFDFAEPDHVTAGAVGPPGQRVFYLQARQAGEVVSLRLEKQQVAALCDYLAGILADLAPVAEELPTELDLIEPVLAEWVVGALAVAYEEADDRIVLVAEELVPEADDEDEDEDDPASFASDDDDDELPSTARFRMSRAQVLAMVRHAAAVVTAGREVCQICGRPMDPEGHLCPRNN
jgi:uncharacterized repeat protein (TIGR03847 family)